MGDEAEVVAMLVVNSEHVHHINQVAGLTTREILFLKRKFASRLGYELTRYPLEECTSLAYFDERSLASLISGVFVTAVVALAVGGLLYNWSDLDAGTRVPIGALVVGGLYGVRRLFGSRRHRMVFTLRDQTKLSWISSSGDYERWKPSAASILEFARERRLLSAS